MVAPTYTHEQMTTMLEQFKLVPPKLQSDFLAHVALNQELRGNPQVLVGAMQGVINQAAQLAATAANPFAALLTAHQVVIPEHLKAMNAPGSGVSNLTVPGPPRDTTRTGPS
ncbi:MAG: hypothetical protein K2X09_04420 [Rickettsiales bacterium]|nr:hypothetical protein [Rickettsiales bacterium]